MKLAIVGAGWAGLAAAVAATAAGHAVQLFEASRQLGGRARSLTVVGADGQALTLDNGQHILIGAYTDTLALMRQVGVDPATALRRLPLSLRFADGGGLAWPDLPAPWDTLVALAGARGWRLADKASLLRLALGWRLGGFRCPPQATVAALCAGASARVRDELIEPLCVSALNLGADQASGQVFLRVLQDALFAAPRGSNLLLPRHDLGALFPQAAARWLARHGGAIRLGERVGALQADGARWRVQGEDFDRVLLACPAWDAARLLDATAATLSDADGARALRDWSACAGALAHTAISTVYAFAPDARLAAPMLALRSGSGPAQFVFDRGQLGGPPGLLALVVSASAGERAAIEAAALQQLRTELGLAATPLRTVVERRAAFACTPQARRPPMTIAPGLLACGDHVQGPYPSTLEGAVRSGLAAIRSPAFAS